MSPAATETVNDVPSDFAEVLSEHIRAGYQIMYVPTSEEARVEREIDAVAKRNKSTMVTWDQYEGLALESWNTAERQKYRDPLQALQALEGNLPIKDGVFVFRDLDDFFPAPPVRRAMRSLCEGNRLSNNKMHRPIIITSPKLDIHPKLKSCMTVLDFSLPDEARLQKVFEYIQKSVANNAKQNAKIQAECPDDLRDQIISAMLGLTSTEAENALSRCIVRHGGFCPEMVRTIKDEKAQAVRKSEVLTYKDEDEIAERDDIGGFDELLTFIDRRKQAYSREARALQLDYPKGITLIGVPGTGKSMVAMAVSKILGLPLYTMDVGAIFGSLVGESEGRMRDAIRQITAQNGCVLLIDEADKAWGNAHDSRGDSGVTQRIFGQLLTWLAAKQDRTFVIMTMNRTTGIPPEFLRAGRFDAVFYTDLPNDEERRQIIDIHFRKRGVDITSLQLEDDDWTQIIEKTKGFVGSELEELVKESRYISFESRKSGTPTLPEIMQASAGIVPLSVLDEKGVEEIRSFCAKKARPVSRERRPGSRKGREMRGIAT